MVSAALTFKVPQASFEGPLELLLDLIERRKLLINDVALAAVTDEYIAYTKSLEEHPIPETADFVYVASTLLLIKSKSLLPVLDLTTEEENTIEELAHRLKLYQLFRDISADIGNRFGVTMLYEKPFIAPSDPLFVTDKYSSVPALREAMNNVLSNLIKKPFTPQTTVRKVISLEDTMKQLEKRILTQFKMKFSDFTKDAGERGTVIVGFLAVLELVKQGFVNVRQEERFADIDIEREGIDIPKYS